MSYLRHFPKIERQKGKILRKASPEEREGPTREKGRDHRRARGDLEARDKTKKENQENRSALTGRFNAPSPWEIRANPPTKDSHKKNQSWVKMSSTKKKRSPLIILIGSARRRNGTRRNRARARWRSSRGPLCTRKKRTVSRAGNGGVSAGRRAYRTNATTSAMRRRSCLSERRSAGKWWKRKEGGADLAESERICRVARYASRIPKDEKSNSGLNHPKRVLPKGRS